MAEYTDLQEAVGSTQERNLDVRKALNDAYAFVEGMKTSQSFSAFTVEEAHDLFTERVEGKGTVLRPNEIDRIDRTIQRIKSVVAEVKTLPPEAFQLRNSEDNVNT